MTLFAQLALIWRPLLGGVTVVGVAISVAKFFEWLDRMISDEGRVALWMLLGDLPSEERIESWGNIFPHLIDRVFGRKALSLKFFSRSCVASLSVLLIVTPLYYLATGPRDTGETFPTVLSLVLLLSPITNFAPDYLSVLVTRAIVRSLAKRPTIGRALVLFVVDIIATAVVADMSVYAILILFIVAIRMLIDRSISVAGFFTISGVVSFLGLLFKGSFYRVLFCVFVISAFFTSIWLWLYLLSIGLIYGMKRTRAVWMTVSPYLDIEKDPMAAIGRVAGVLAGATWAAILGIAWIVRHWH